MKRVEEASEALECRFVDLFVRATNKKAIEFYERLGYVTYRIVDKYYGGNSAEDAYDMRKPLLADPTKGCLEGAGHRCTVNDIQDVLL